MDLQESLLVLPRGEVPAEAWVLAASAAAIDWIKLASASCCWLVPQAQSVKLVWSAFERDKLCGRGAGCVMAQRCCHLRHLQSVDTASPIRRCSCMCAGLQAASRLLAAVRQQVSLYETRVIRVIQVVSVAPCGHNRWCGQWCMRWANVPRGGWV
jgi:hypothetical protein